MAAVLSNDSSTHKSRCHAHSSKIPIHSTRRKTRASAAVGRSPKKTPSIRISSTVPITSVPSTITISSSSPDYNESWPTSEQATPPAPIRSLFYDEKQKEEIDTSLLSSSLTSSSLQSLPQTQLCPQSHMQQQKYDQTLTERTQQLIDSSTALIRSPTPNISLHRKEPSTSPPLPCVEEEGDILQQWRLRRRLEEARHQATAPSVSHLGKRVPHCSVPKGDITTLHELQQETGGKHCSQSHNSHPSQNYRHESHNSHDHHKSYASCDHHKSHISRDCYHKSHNSHDHHKSYTSCDHHKSHTSRDHQKLHNSQDHHHVSHNAHTSQNHDHRQTVQNHNASSACNVKLCRHISEQSNKKMCTHKKERPKVSSEQPMQQKETLVKDEKRRQFKTSSWKEECVRYPLSLSGSDDDTSWDTDSLITDNTSPPPHSSSLAEDVSLTQLLTETVQKHLYGTPPPASPGVPSHIYPCATPCPEVDNHLKDELLAELFKRALSLSKTISEVDQRLAAMDTT